MKPLYSINLLRRLILPLFARLNPGDVTIRHHYTHQNFRLHSFKHKGFWFHGANREKSTMRLFSKLIDEGATVVEVGGHIGYISVYFAQLVGEQGSVIIFEPGPNNLPYLLENTARQKHVVVIPKAVGDVEAHLPFYVEELTGQNNTLIKDFVQFSKNMEHAHVNVNYHAIMVDVVTLDTVLPELARKIDFIKIDVEGAELGVLEGAVNTIKSHKPILMVESNDTGDVLYQYFSSLDYVSFSPIHGLVHAGSEMKSGNYFCVHPEWHSDAYQLLTHSTT